MRMSVLALVDPFHHALTLREAVLPLVHASDVVSVWNVLSRSTRTLSVGVAVLALEP